MSTALCLTSRLSLTLLANKPVTVHQRSHYTNNKTFKLIQASNLT